MAFSDLFKKKTSETDMKKRETIISNAVSKIFELESIRSYTNEYRVRALAGFVLAEIGLLNVLPPPGGNARDHIEKLNTAGINLARSFHVKPLKTFITAQERESFLSRIPNVRMDMTAETECNADFVFSFLLDYYGTSQIDSLKKYNPESYFLWASFCVAKITFGEKSVHFGVSGIVLPVLLEATKQIASLRV